MLMYLISVTIATCFAQAEIQFTITKSTQDNLSEDVIDALDLRLKQIFSRNSASATNAYNVFLIEPYFELSETLTSDGLIQEVSLIKGELTLMAKNKIDNAIYYTLTIPVSGNSVGNQNDAMKNLIRNIKITDPKFTRYIRTARKKITDHYTANCESIIQRTQLLYEQNRYEEAQNYINAVPEIAPCYKQVSDIQIKIAKSIPATPDTVFVERIIEKGVPSKQENNDTLLLNDNKTTVVEDTPVNIENQYDIFISVNDMSVKIIKCFGNKEQRRITLQLEVTNQNEDILNTNVCFNSAYTQDGVECKKLGALSDWKTSYVNMPYDVALKQNYYIMNVNSSVTALKYIELIIRDAKIIIRNLPVEW